MDHHPQRANLNRGWPCPFSPHPVPTYLVTPQGHRPGARSSLVTSSALPPTTPTSLLSARHCPRSSSVCTFPRPMVNGIHPMRDASGANIPSDDLCKFQRISSNPPQKITTTFRFSVAGQRGPLVPVLADYPLLRVSCRRDPWRGQVVLRSERVKSR